MSSIQQVASHIVSTWEEGNCDYCSSDTKGRCIAVDFILKNRTFGDGSPRHYCSTDCYLEDKNHLKGCLGQTVQYFCGTHGSGGALLNSCKEKLHEDVSFFCNKEKASEVEVVFKKHFPGYLFQYK